jgi:hypothetical protein
MVAFGYQSPTCRWVPFWRAQGELYTVEPEPCKVSLYRKGSEVMLVMLNDSPQDAVLKWKPSEAFGLFGVPSDAERENEALLPWRFRKPDGTWHIFVGAFDYRMVRVCTKGKW